ncbi:hypothetical protein Tco_1299158 [Tanacetum coccineum]
MMWIISHASSKVLLRMLKLEQYELWGIAQCNGCRRCSDSYPEEMLVAQLLTDEKLLRSVIGINKGCIDKKVDDKFYNGTPFAKRKAIKGGQSTLDTILVEL